MFDTVEITKISNNPSQRSQTQNNSDGIRQVVIGQQEHSVPDNSISTTKYTIYNFFVVNLIEQFSKIANVYFLFLSLLQMIKLVSITHGIPTILPPLSFIVLLTMIKDVYEDYKRYKSDQEENNKETLVFQNGDFVTKRWREVRVGDIIKVVKNEFFPADLVMISSSDYRKGQCFIETKNLDGETNLKGKFVSDDLKERIKSDRDALAMAKRVIDCELPNQYLNRFKGAILEGDNKFPLSANNLLLRGCILRNTDYIIGCAVYTGHESKVMLNSVRARPKKSTLEIDTGKRVITTFVILIMICLGSGLDYAFWESNNEKMINSYITKDNRSFFINVVVRMGNWILIFGNFVPISLMLTLETVKFFQGTLMSIDKGLIATNGIECKVQSSNLNEELGQIDYVFSDKTGTLTCNEMRFKYLIIGEEVYGKRRGYDGEMPYVQNVDFEDPKVWHIKNNNFSTDDCQRLKEALILLGLCHSVVLEQNGDYNASSPDELAFVYFAKLVGCEYKGMDEDNFIVLQEFNETKKYKLLDLFEFNSDRKRMSAIVEDQNGKITMYCKGADSIMIPRYHEERKHKYHETIQHLEDFAAIGLRTLLLGAKSLTRDEYDQFKKEYDVEIVLPRLQKTTWITERKK